MRSTSRALNAARASRGYLFSVVTCAVLLTALALVQWLRAPRPSGPWTLQIVATSPPGAGAGINENLKETLLRSRVVAKARRQVAATPHGSGLETGGALQSCLAVVEEENGDPNQSTFRLVYRGGSAQGGALLRRLAELYAQEHVDQRRADSAALLRSAKSAWEAVRKEYDAASRQFQQATRAAQRVQEEIRRKQAEIADLLHQRHPTPEPRQAAAADAPLQPQSVTKQRLAGLRTQRAQLLEHFTARHPSVQEIDNRIRHTSATEIEQPDAQAPPPAVSPTLLTEGGEHALAPTQAKLEEELATLNEKLQSLDATRDKQMTKLAALQEDLEQRAAEVVDAKAKLKRTEKSDVCIAEAVRSRVQSPPTDAIGLFFSLAFGSLVGCIASMRAKSADTRLRDRSQVESLLAVPVVGLLPGAEDPPQDPPPAPPTQSHTAHTVQRTAEVALGLFFVTTLSASAFADNFSARLTSQPLSAIADSVREVVHALS